MPMFFRALVIDIVSVGDDGVEAVVPAGELHDDQDVVVADAGVGRRCKPKANCDMNDGIGSAEADDGELRRGRLLVVRDG